jgi:hypothetical protein
MQSKVTKIYQIKRTEEVFKESLMYTINRENTKKNALLIYNGILKEIKKNSILS